MNYLDLFHGIGGFALGAYWAGMKFENHYCSDIEPYCQELYAKRFPNSIQLGDITKIDTSKLPKGDWIISGGFPCQDISIAGKGVGIHGKRSGLWFEYWRIINDLRPRFAIMENVGMLVHRGLREVLGSLAEIGYNAEWQDIRASDVGAPHRRERIWIIAYPCELRCNAGRAEQSLQRTWAYGKAQSAKVSYPDKRTGGNVRKNIADGQRGKSAHDAGPLYANVSHTDNTRLEGRNGEELRECPGERITGESNSLSYHDSVRMEGHGAKQQTARFDECIRSYGWDSEPDVGGGLDGLPVWMGRHVGRGMSYEESRRANKILFSMWEVVDSEKVRKTIRGFNRIQKAEILFALVREYQKNSDKTRILTQSEEALKEFVRGVWIQKELDSAPHRSRYNEQHTGEYSDSMQTLSRLLAYDGEENKYASSWEDGVSRLSIGIPHRVDRLRGLGNAIVPQIAELLFRQIKGLL